MDTLVDKAVNGFGIRETDLHFGGVYVYIRFHRRDRQMENGKRKAVLHEVGPVTGFKGLGERIAFEHSPVHEKDLEISGRPADIGSP